MRRKQTPSVSLGESTSAVNHAHRGVNGRVPVHDTASVSGRQRGVPEKKPGCPWTQHAV